MQGLTAEDLAAAARGEIETLSRLDGMGYFPAPGESPEAFAARLRDLSRARAELLRTAEHAAGCEIYPGVKLRAADRIPERIVRQVHEQTQGLYGFCCDYVPGFFCTERFGWLWGGCSFADPERNWNAFIIRSEFRTRERFFIYHRTELMAHELCHAARQVLADIAPEEYFAYQTSSSALRRFLGNCFVYRYDAALFLGPVLVLLAVQIAIVCGGAALPIAPFYGLAAAGPLFLLLRNLALRGTMARAAHRLRRMNVGAATARAVLFRLRYAEIRRLAGCSDSVAVQEFWTTGAAAELRLRIIFEKYLRPGMTGQSADAAAELETGGALRKRQ